jgi:hypothetical protein
MCVCVFGRCAWKRDVQRFYNGYEYVFSACQQIQSWIGIMTEMHLILAGVSRGGVFLEDAVFGRCVWKICANTLYFCEV